MRWSNILHPDTLPPAQQSVHHISAPRDFHYYQMPAQATAPLAALYPPSVPAPPYAGPMATLGHWSHRDDDQPMSHSAIPWDDYEFRPALGDRRLEDQPVSPTSQYPDSYYHSRYASSAGSLYDPTVSSPSTMPTGPPLGDPSSLRLRGAMYNLPTNPDKKRSRDGSKTRLLVEEEYNLCVDSGTRGGEYLEERPAKKRKPAHVDPLGTPRQPFGRVDSGPRVVTTQGGAPSDQPAQLEPVGGQSAFRAGVRVKPTPPGPPETIPNLRRSARLVDQVKSKREGRLGV